MARKRMIEPGLWNDDGFLSLSVKARLLWIGMISHADDEGRGSASARALKAKVFPGDGMDDQEILALRDEVAANMRVQVYGNGEPHYQLTRWNNHQSIKDKKPSTVPPPEPGDTSPTPPRDLPDASPGPPPNEGMKEGRKEGAATSTETPGRKLALAWYKAHFAVSLKPLTPTPDDYRRAEAACADTDGSGIVAMIPDYFSGDWWFTKHKVTKRPQYNFSDFLRHLSDLSSAPVKPPKRRGWICINGHENRHTGSMCLTCGADRSEQARGPEDAERIVKGAKG